MSTKRGIGSSFGNGDTHNREGTDTKYADERNIIFLLREIFNHEGHKELHKVH